ncbi:putative O-methyltransferase YrrM [Sporomusaceae bacterium BoRhaA]|uniref:O-methyltransferase n=1 Tax=Pelorhabdus rhamnosifermentans TaxID=2772457 RepID=UPI001C063309|nr:class I SAM-dependent methyltransferase [Pelorhabdus rhamnosifermentans]MBU2702785.1 putative O-methyltransferase YrrM [Pelorhabdus rhamnosifermentans]
MDFKKASAYIERLYEKRKLTKKQYIETTELKEFGTVVDDDVARMLQVLITLVRPRKILEIGTSVGFSTVSMAKVIKQYGGKIVTVEIDRDVARQAVKNFEREGVKEQIEVRIGDARAIISSMNEEFDLIFQDVGDKKLYGEMLEDYIRVLKPGGVLLAEDTLFPVFDFGSDFSDLTQMCEALDIFNKKIADCPQFESTLLPIGDGLTVAVKRIC